MPSAADAFEFPTQVTTIFKRGAQRHALMRYALCWRAALDKVSSVECAKISIKSTGY